MNADDVYEKRLERELQNYNDDVDVHALPDIFHYWSNKYVRPWFEDVGTTHPEAFFVKFLLQAGRLPSGKEPRFLSVGSGNCDVEVEIATQLRHLGLESFTLECLDINERMLSRGRDLAQEKGVAECLEFVKADFNSWEPKREYDAILANQCLHHVQDLERLFDAIARSLSSKGMFITSDMIGRNGHQRWPEAEDIVREVWSNLDDKYKYNHQLQRLEIDFVNHDCSSESFEGIRAQDILPLLLDKFSFEIFIAFGNVVDVFVDRAFGHNFDANSEVDRRFIDELHAIDEKGFSEGTLSPTHMVAVLRKKGARIERGYCARGLTPEKAVRRPDTL